MRSLLASLLLAAPGIAQAQALSCTVPAGLPPARKAGPSESDPVRRLPIGGYTLALSWSPEFCRSERGPGSAFQCNRNQRFGFVLHGLWPDGRGRQWPQYCRPAALLPRTVLRENLCATPSVDLMQHEWAKHGTCMTDDPDAYFDKARGLYGALRYPDMAALSRQRSLTVGAFARAFVVANRGIPGLTAASVRVRLSGGKWLDEIWLCLDGGLKYAACARNQAGGAAANRDLAIWRGGNNR